MFENKDILIIGGTGFIGKYLVKRLLGLNCKLTIISLNSKNNGNNKNISHFNVNISKKDEIKNFFHNREFDFIFNLAGYVNHGSFRDSGEEIISQHFLSLIYQFQFINKTRLKKYIYIGSADEFTDLSHNEKISEKKIGSPKTSYSFSKYASINFLQMLYRSENWPVTIARVFLTYGPGQLQNRLIPHVILNGLKYGYVNTTEGSQIRDFCFIEDIIDGLIILTINEDTTGNIYNIASGQPISIKEIIGKISKILNFKVNFGAINKKKGEPFYQVADISFIKRTLNWSPKINLDQGLKMTINSFLNDNK